MDSEKITYDEAAAEIEKIMAKFRSGEVSVDQLTHEVKRATELITYCRNILTSAEGELKKILE